MNPIETYMTNTSDENKKALRHIRELVHKEVSDVDEVLSYGMPGFRMKSTGKVVLGFAINKHSLAVYPHSGRVLDHMMSDISKWRTSLSALNFTPADPIPDTILKELLAVRVQEIIDGYGQKK
jgi:uncharacterized protein YdhG (YjbR/CyaY superfamily)